MLVQNDWLGFVPLVVLLGVGKARPIDPEEAVDVSILGLVEVTLYRVLVLLHHLHQSQVFVRCVLEALDELGPFLLERFPNLIHLIGCRV